MGYSRGALVLQDYALPADLLVAGAFGHLRVFESLFGGVSLDLLRQRSCRC